MCLASAVVMPANDAVVKYLAVSLPPEQLAWARFFFNFLLLAPAAFWRYGVRALTVPRPLLQLVRGCLIVASNLLFIAGVRVVPLADAMALVFVAPLAVTALSPFLLGERVGSRRWAAVLVGFAGALVIVRPGFGATGASLLPMGAGLSFALYLVITRKLAGISAPIVTQAATSAVGAVLTTMAVPLVWVAPTPAQFGLMVVIGIASCVGHVLLTIAHESAPASTLAPFTYLGIVGAAVLGFLVFGDLPDATTWAGATIVIASGLYIWLRERRRGLSSA